MTELTKTQIIQETMEYYGTDPARRALNPTWRLDNTSRCLYLTKKGLMCAVGRCLVAPERMGTGSVGDLWTSISENLKPQYQGHDVKFWGDLQRFHDKDVNWTDSGLSPDGAGHYHYLMQRYAD